MAAQVAKKQKGAGTVVLAPPGDIPVSGSAAPGKVVLVYWPIRGLAQAARYALEYCGEDWEDVQIDPGTPGTDDYKGHWMVVKPTIGVPFVNLPYLLDGEVEISQSAAILRHIGRKHGLLGTDPATCAKVDQVIDQCADFDGPMTRMCYGNYAGRDEWAETKMAPGLQAFEQFLGSNDYIAGPTITVADFKLFEEVAKCEIIVPGCLDSLPGLAAYMARMRSLEPLAGYLSSDRFIERPLNNPHAQFK